MNRFQIERYALIAQIIDNAEVIDGIDFYDYDGVKIETVLERWDAKVYSVSIPDEKVRMSIWFTNADRDISVDLVTNTDTEECCRIYYKVDYDEHHHARLVEEE